MKTQIQRNRCQECATKAALIIFGLVLQSLSFNASAQTAPPAPVLTQPANGAALVQPITLAWNPVVDPDGPIGSYIWQVGTSSTFATIIAEGFQNMISDTIPTPTKDVVSGLPNGTYFWRVKATQMVGGTIGSIESPWSVVRSFTVTGLGPAPATPTITSPGNNSSFHVAEFFDIKWGAVAGANYYLLEADDEPTFSYPLTLTIDAMQFGTKFNAGWGNAIPNIYYRVRAVSINNVRSLPSPTVTVHISNNAPVPPAPTPLSPVGGVSITMPSLFDFTDTANPQIPGYDVDIDDEPNFLGTVGVLLAQGVSRSDYLVLPDPLVENRNIFPPGQYFWRVRAIHGDVFGPWSAGVSFNVVAAPATPPGLEIFSIITEPGSVSGGNSTQARVTLNMPAGPGGALIKIAPDLPHAQTPATILIPEGKTDGIVSPITTIPVRGATLGTIQAAYGLGWQQNSIGLWPILWGMSLNNESVIGGNAVTATLTLLNPAPAGGVVVTLVSSDTSIATPPAKISIPAGGTGATFTIPTSPVSVPARVVFNSGTAFEGFRAPDVWLAVMPAGSAPPTPSLADLSLANSVILGESSTTATVTLTGPAPAGGALVRLNGSMEGQVVNPQSVTVPAGSISATFPINAPQVNAPNYALIQATYGTSGGMQARLLEIDPGPPGAPILLAMAVKPFQEIGGNSLRGTVELVMPAPAGGGVVALNSDNPAAHVPPIVSIAAGNTANSFTITTSPVTTSTPVNITATAGGVTKSFFIYLGPDPNAPPLLGSVTISPSTVPGGTSATGTVLLNSPAPAGGASVTLSTSNFSVAQAPGVVTVPAGQTSATFTVTTFTVSSTTVASITAFLGSASKSANITVTSGGASTPGTPTLVSPANGATPAQPITLDWSDVSGAASYEIQVDDSSGFTTPLVRSLTSTASQTSVTSLASVQHWWRVRAKNSAGVAGNWSASRSFTPQSATPPPPATLSSLTLNPTSVTGGNTSQGTVILTSAAPSGGGLVVLSSSASTVAGVPSSVTVAAGASSATFTVTSATVTSAASVTISASYSSVTRTATLTVNPPSSGPLPAPSLVSPAADARFSPGANITFDWSDVSGAANYTIQIDDSSSFPSPLIVQQSTTSSQFSTSSLPTTRMWWRVRANDASGNPGNWSSSRRFEVKN